MKYHEQLALWLGGTPVHREQCCCPDFSCCRPELLAPLDVRELFVAAYSSGKENVTGRLLMTFLSKAFSESHNVHIAGLGASRMEVEDTP